MLPRAIFQLLTNHSPKRILRIAALVPKLSIPMLVWCSTEPSVSVGFYRAHDLRSIGSSFGIAKFVCWTPKDFVMQLRRYPHRFENRLLCAAWREQRAPGAGTSK
jgi:hypothetical protein